MNLTILDTANGRHSSWNWPKTSLSQTPRLENLTLKNLIQGLTVDLFQHKAQEQKIHIRIAKGLIFKHRQMIKRCFQLGSCQLVTIGNKGIQPRCVGQKLTQGHIFSTEDRIVMLQGQIQLQLALLIQKGCQSTNSDHLANASQVIDQTSLSSLFFLRIS